VVRPEATPCGGSSALSGDDVALQGLRPPPARTVIGSVRPARRFDALRALARSNLPSRLAPDGGPPCAFVSLRGPSQHPRTVPWIRRSTRRTMLPPLDFVASRHMRGGGPVRARGFRPRTVPRPGFGYPPRGVHHRPLERLAAPQRPQASPFKAFSSHRSLPLSEALALVTFLASIRLAPLGSVRTRAPSGP
jgi:hypothetical protein